jgi:hypothetical protein
LERTVGRKECSKEGMFEEKKELWQCGRKDGSFKRKVGRKEGRKVGTKVSRKWKSLERRTFGRKDG